MRHETIYNHFIDYGRESLKRIINKQEKNLINDVQEALKTSFEVDKPFEWFWHYRGIFSKNGHKYLIEIVNRDTSAFVRIKHEEVKDTKKALTHIDEIEKIIEYQLKR